MMHQNPKHELKQLLHNVKEALEDIWKLSEIYQGIPNVRFIHQERKYSRNMTKIHDLVAEITCCRYKPKKKVCKKHNLTTNRPLC